jgi:glycosyltransferase involved in cell wall biosynthesis
MYPSPDQPAYGSFVASQVASLHEEGVETDVVFIDGRSSSLNYFRGVREVRDKVRSGAYDVVHAHYGLTGCIARLQGSLPLVVSFCGDDILGTPRAEGGRTARSLVVVGASHLLESVADAIIVKSEEMRTRLWFRASRERALVLPNGVDLRRFKAMPVAEARRQLGLDPSKLYVLFPNTPYERRKRVDLAQAAVEILAKRVANVELLVVYHKPPAQLPTYYSAANALLLTSDWEGSPNVVKEALACDLPVISVSTGDVRERIEGAPGCQISDRDPAQLATALEQTLRMERPTDLHERVAALDTRAVARRLIEVYESVARSMKRSRGESQCAV